jgi:perosamine synthetase
VTPRIPHNRPLIADLDRAAVDAVLASGWVAQGPRVAALEAEFVRMYGGGVACAVSSGTAALFLALRSLGIREKDAVAVPSYSCSALLNAVNMLGAHAIPVDIRTDDFVVDPASVERLAPDAKAIIAVHTFGASAPVADLRAPGRVIVEDCCQSLGGGQGRDGDAAVYSFYATKIVTGGQGGLVWSRDARPVEAVRDYREFDCRETYVPRFNFQMTDIQAAMIVSQLGRLDQIRARRRVLRAVYLAAAAGLIAAGWRAQAGLDPSARLPYRFVLVAPSTAERDALKTQFDSNGIGCIIPVERYELLHRYLDLPPKNYPVSEMLANCALSLPLYPALSDADAEAVCAVLRRAT